VVDLELLADRDVELIGHERARNVPAELRVAGQRRKRPRAEALVGDGIRVCDAERERRVGVEEELVHVVVVDHHQPVGLELLEPVCDLLEGAEERLPLVGLAHLLARVVDVLHRRRVARADPSHDARHQLPPLSRICLPISGSGVSVTPESLTIT
jgi:hypothetical protein